MMKDNLYGNKKESETHNFVFINNTKYLLRFFDFVVNLY